MMDPASGTVSMKREVVRLRISRHVIHADCSFEFQNDGPECTVRMGFPDSTTLPNSGKHGKLHGSFLTYARFVDGNKIATEEVEGSAATKDDDLFYLWHASEVRFDAGGERNIRETYSLTPGVAEVADNCALKTASYLLHTGSSWHGNIDAADVYVTFDHGVVSEPLNIVHCKAGTDSDKDKEIRTRTDSIHPDTVFTNHTPTVDGRTLHYHFENFRPTIADDLMVMYGPMKTWKAAKYTLGLHARNFLRSIKSGNK